MSMNRYISFLILFLSLTLFSCQIREEVVFNEDFSGSYSFSIDLKELMGQLLAAKMSSNVEDVESYNPAAEFKKVILEGGLETIAYLDTDSLEQALGLTNLQVTNDTFNFAIIISFDFDDFQKLNAFYRHLNRSSTTESSFKNSFEWDKENMIFTYTQTVQVADSESGGSKAPQGIFDQFEIYTKYAFPFKIKEVNEELAVVDYNKLELSLPFNYAFEEGRKLIVTFE